MRGKIEGEQEYFSDIKQLNRQRLAAKFRFRKKNKFYF